ncbi:MAG: hypothetical protein J0M24_18170 [Verrucomicrobia bacterium]|nr:hypothetical protein [Verrucomicrobiota bacterium]
MKSLFLLASLGLVVHSSWGEESWPESTRSLFPSLTGSALEIRQDNRGITLTFTGTLEAAPTAQGPWSAVPGAVSPYQPATLESVEFFRAVDSTATGFFDSRSVASFTVAGPLQAHFNLAFAGMPDGIFPPVREKPYFEGQVTLGSQQIPVSLRVRGNSSLQECPFPKLKFKVSRADRAGTPFAEAREVKIGTHCAEGGRGSIGRLRDERATFREAVVYEIVDLLGFLAPRVRRAAIEFRDTSPSGESIHGGWQLTRKAMVLEDAEVVAERLGGRALDDEEVGALRDANFRLQEITELRMLHVLLGNWDFALSTSGESLWNTDVIQLSNGTYRPMVGDFDLASWVTAEVRPNFPHDYLPELPELDRQARYELELIQKSVSAEVFQTGRAHFESHRTALESWVAAAEVDEPGRTNALNHVTTFFGALSAVSGPRR